MTYASVAQLKAAIPPHDLELLTDFERAAEPSDARLLEALKDASAEINGYISKVVKRPLADPPHILAVICRDLAMHRLYVNLGRNMEVYDIMRRDAVAMLKSIARGETAIGDDGESDQIVTPGVAMTDGPERQLTRDKLWGF